jgi:nickel transport protein
MTSVVRFVGLPGLAGAIAPGLVLLLASVASAHEVLHAVERSRAVAVKAYEADGEVLADTPFEVFSPAAPNSPWQTGRTDRGGWVAFVPDTPGRWRVRVTGDTGHGLDVPVDVEAPHAVGRTASGDDDASTVAFVLRPLVSALVIVSIFAALALVYRRKRGDGG